MAKLTGDIIKAGLHVWVVGGGMDCNDMPVEVVIDTGEIDAKYNTVDVLRMCDNSSPACIPSDQDTGKYVLYLGDSGVRPYNYDDRQTQVFTTREELVEAMEAWAGKIPNFIAEE